KPQNPLARNYESNGPDVKIRGTAAHIAEKYMSLARDALASGDMVTAESYLQHAEHYNRIIMAAQLQMGGQHGHQGEGPNGGGDPPRWSRDAIEDEGGEFDSVEGGGEMRAAGGGGSEFRQGGGEMRGSQDRERHEGNREHHGGAREQGGGRRHGGNGSDGGRDRDANGSGQAARDQPDEAQPHPPRH